MRKITQPGGSWLPALLVSALVHAGTGAFGGAVRLGLLNALQLLPLTLAPSLPAIIEREREEEPGHRVERRDPGLVLLANRALSAPGMT